jgi:curved DNA-binding protein CbpA
MQKIHTHYENLKVARNAPTEVIRAAYRSLSLKHHPDRNPDDKNANKVMEMLNVAYETLSDANMRKEHDLWIAEEEARLNQFQRDESYKENVATGNTSSGANDRGGVKKHYLYLLSVLGSFVGAVVGYFFVNNGEDKFFNVTVGVLTGFAAVFFIVIIMNGRSLIYELKNSIKHEFIKLKTEWIWLLLFIPLFLGLQYLSEEGGIISILKRL